MDHLAVALLEVLDQVATLVVGMDTLGQGIIVADTMETMAGVVALEGLGWGWVGACYWGTHWGV